MADDVTIANLATARLGEAANIASINPPEKSRAAQLAAQFFDIARDSSLELYPWDFATDTVKLTPSATITKLGWTNIYVRPTNAIKIFAVLPEGAADEYVAQLPVNPVLCAFSPEPVNYSVKSPVKFATAIDIATGTQIIKTNCPPDAYARCIFRITDTQLFSPLFTDMLAWQLAAYMAGPIYKGKTGIEVTKALMQSYQYWFTQAMLSNAQQEDNNPEPVPSNLQARN